MSLVWHIVRKDFRRVGIGLALWLFLLLMDVYFVLVIDGRESLGQNGFEGLGNMVSAWRVIVVAVGYILAAWLVMEDPLTSSRAFWRTRPVHGARLLAAKALGALLLLGVLPAVALLPFWWSCGFSAGEMRDAVVALLSEQAVIALFAFAVAAITETSGQFLIRTLGLAVLGPALVAYGLGVIAPPVGVRAGVMESRQLLVMALCGLTPMAVIVHQYLTRRHLRSHAMLALGCLLLFGVRLAWPVDFLSWRSRAEPAESQSERAFAIERAAQEGRQINLQGTAGSPSGMHFRVRSATACWLDADGRRWSATRFTRPPGGGHPAEAIVRSVLGLPSDQSIAPETWQLTGRESEEWLTEARRRGLKLRVDVSGDLMPGRVIARLPLRNAVATQDGSVRTCVADVRHTADGSVVLRIKEREAGIGSLLGVYSNERAHAGLREGRDSEDSYVLLNARLGVVKILGGAPDLLQIYSIRLRQREFTFKPPTHEVAGREEEIAGWENDAEIVRVRFTSEKTFQRRVTVDPFLPLKS